MVQIHRGNHGRNNSKGLNRDYVDGNAVLSHRVPPDIGPTDVAIEMDTTMQRASGEFGSNGGLENICSQEMHAYLQH